MPVIAVSSDSTEQGEAIARQVAEKLGYRLLGRELLDEVARDNDLDQAEMIKALDEAPGFLGMRARRRRELLTHVQAACLEKLLDDDVVCHGLAAHLYVVGVSHALRVRVLDNPGRRAAALSEQKGLDKEKVRKLLEKETQDRRRWSLEAFGEDETDPAMYDMVLSLATLDPDQAVDIICEAAAYPKFQAMTYSRKCMADFALASQVRRKLMQQFPDIRVRVSDGTVVAHVLSLRRDQRKKQELVRKLAGEVPGVSYVEVHVINDVFAQAAQSER